MVSIHDSRFLKKTDYLYRMIHGSILWNISCLKIFQTIRNDGITNQEQQILIYINQTVNPQTKNGTTVIFR